MIVDAHNDLLLELAFRALRRHEPDPFGRHWLEPLREGGVALQVCPAYCDLPYLPEGALREVLGQIAVFNRTVRDHGDQVIAVRTRSDLAVVERGERIGLMLSLEGAEPLGYDPWMAELMWELGVRMMSLTWNRRNPFADGAAESPSGGLSALGRKLLELCADLGMIIDLAHLGEASYWEALEHGTDAAFVVSHAACRALCDHPRNLTDDQLRALAERGGVLGIMMHPIVIGSGATIDRVIDHVDHAVSVMGIDHVGLGGDFTRQVVRAVGWIGPPDALLPPELAPDAAIEGLAGPEEYPHLIQAMTRRGYVGESLEAILHGNLIRLFRKALPT